jgi:CTD kinase subunit beta
MGDESRGSHGYAPKPTISDSLLTCPETLLDLLDLYTHQRSATSIGPLYSLETFINIRITLNTEASRLSLPRFTPYASEKTLSTAATSPATPAALNGLKPRNGVETAPTTPATPGTISPAQPDAGAPGARGQGGTVRFMLDAARARDERAQVDKYHRVEEEEYEVEVPNERFEEGEKERERERRRVR